MFGRLVWGFLAVRDSVLEHIETDATVLFASFFVILIAGWRWSSDGGLGAMIQPWLIQPWLKLKDTNKTINRLRRDRYPAWRTFTLRDCALTQECHWQEYHEEATAVYALAIQIAVSGSNQYSFHTTPNVSLKQYYFAQVTVVTAQYVGAGDSLSYSGDLEPCVR